MEQEDLVRVIAEPARLGNWQFVEGLVEQIVEDMGQEPGRLLLLSHALLETWDRRRGGVMTLGGYRAAGGVEGAIAQTAEETLASLIEENPNFETVTCEIFLDLTELGEGAEDTRRVATREELSAGLDDNDLDTVLDELADARLITLAKDEVEVAHEALIRRWPKLHESLEDNRERLRFERQLKHDVQAWQELDRDAGALYRGAPLAVFGVKGNSSSDICCPTFELSSPLSTSIIHQAWVNPAESRDYSSEWLCGPPLVHECSHYYDHSRQQSLLLRKKIFASNSRSSPHVA
jgi:hypothetical protein